MGARDEVAWPLLIDPCSHGRTEDRNLTVRQARRLFTDGDIKSEVAFQHDVNRLLASLEDLCDSAEELRSARASSNPGGTSVAPPVPRHAWANFTDAASD